MQAGCVPKAGIGRDQAPEGAGVNLGIVAQAFQNGESMVGVLHLEIVSRKVEGGLEVIRVGPHLFLGPHEVAAELIHPSRISLVLPDILHQAAHLAVVGVQLEAGFRDKLRFVETA